MEGVGDKQEKMEGYRSTGQSPQWAVVSMEDEVIVRLSTFNNSSLTEYFFMKPCVEKCH